MAPLFVLARQGRAFEVIAFVFAFATIFVMFLECLRPRVRLRKKAMPKPEIQLNINGPSNWRLNHPRRVVALEGYGLEIGDQVRFAQSAAKPNTPSE